MKTIPDVMYKLPLVNSFFLKQSVPFYFINFKVPEKAMGKRLLSIIIKYKVYHLIFWFLYHFFWWSLTSGSMVEAAQNILYSNYTTKFLFYVVLQALGVYFNLYYLIPKFLQKGNYVVYIPALIATLIITSAGILGGYFINSWVVGVPFEELFYIPPSESFELFKNNAFPSTLASMTLAMSIKLTKNWISSEQHRNTIEKEKLQTELKFLRSQFNPHFLFNTINSIFVLIHKDQDKASNALAKFSDLLRYQLYECNVPFIALELELDYLENFIELQKIRHDRNNFQSQVILKKDALGDLEIAPFILMPFIENAFKHVSHHKEKKNWIVIELFVLKNELHFKVENSRNQLVLTKENNSSGIGLQNVKRRLELLYPNAHELEIIVDPNSYQISLKMHLSNIAVSIIKTA